MCDCTVNLLTVDVLFDVWHTAITDFNCVSINCRIRAIYFHQKTICRDINDPKVYGLHLLKTFHPEFSKIFFATTHICKLKYIPESKY